MGVLSEKFVERLLSDEARQQPSDSVKVEDLEMKLPEWFDEKKYNQGRRFYNDFCFMLSGSMLLGLIAVLAIPSILKILVGTRRSNSVYTAYKRYSSTNMHVTSWFEYELKPGSKSWRSLYTVRSRHIQAGRNAILKDQGTVTQRDVALTLFGFIGFAFLKPDVFGVRQLRKGDWDAYNHSWKVIGHMIGLEDKYNICRDTYEETRQVCQILQDRVFSPCLTNVPEYFEHMAHVMLNGVKNILHGVYAPAMVYAVKSLADVPGYVYKEKERIDLQNKLREYQVNGNNIDTGVEPSALIQKCAIEGLPEPPPSKLYISDFDTLETVPAYRALSLTGKYKLAFNNATSTIIATDIGRMIANLSFKWSLFLSHYFPYVAMCKFGIKKAYVNMFKEDPSDDTIPKPNSEYYKPQPPEAWYYVVLAFLW